MDPDTKVQDIIVEIGLWQCHVSAIFSAMLDTTHRDNCICCLPFKSLGIGYSTDFETMLGREYAEKRVLTLEIPLWEQILNSPSHSISFQNIRLAAKSMFNDDDPCEFINTCDSIEFLGPDNPPRVISSQSKDETLEVFKIPRKTATHLKKQEAKAHHLRIASASRFGRKTSIRHFKSVVTPSSDDEVQIASPGFRRIITIPVCSGDYTFKLIFFKYARAFWAFLSIIKNKPVPIMALINDAKLRAKIISEFEEYEALSQTINN